MTRLCFRSALCVALLVICFPLVSRGAATLNVSLSSIATGTVVNLTQQGPLDWVHWGLFTDSSIDRKGSVPQRISDFTTIDPVEGYTIAYQYADNWNGYSWTDGNPHMAVTNTTTGVWAYAPSASGAVLVGSGFQITVAASTNTQKLYLYVGAYAAKGKLTASLSDNSAPSFTSFAPNSFVDNLTNGPSGLYTITFAANSSNATLTVSYTMVLAHDRYAGNVTLQSAALWAAGANNIPFVTITSPSEGTSVAGPTDVVLSATAIDADGTIDHVVFYEGTNKLGEAASAPY